MYELKQQQQDKITAMLQQDGWEELTAEKRSNHKITPIKDFLIFKRRKILSEVFKNDQKEQENTLALQSTTRGFHVKASTYPKNKPLNFNVSGTGSEIPMSVSEGTLTPTKNDFSKFDSLKKLRENSKPSFVIAYDSEWQVLPDGLRYMLSWQFSVCLGDSMYTFLFIRAGDRVLSLNEALAYILDYFNSFKAVLVSEVKRYSCCVAWNEDKPKILTFKTWQDAYKHGVYKYAGFGNNSDNVENSGGWSRELIPTSPDGTKIPKANIDSRGNRLWSYFHEYLDFENVPKIPITLLCHAGSVDISGLAGTEELMRRISEVQGGWVTLQPTRWIVSSFNDIHHKRVYPVTLSVADTMCHAPTGKKKLADLGNAIGFHKIDIPTKQKEKMFDLLDKDPRLYADYAATDSEVTLLYDASLYGYNKLLPPTMMSATARSVRSEMCFYLGIEDKEFDEMYRGLEIVSHGLFKFPDKPGYIENTSKEPLNADANIVQNFSSRAYHGGYNSCSEVGYFDKITHDYDLKNAYPTAMTLVPDLDWSDPIKFDVTRKEMKLSDFQAIGGILNPVAPFVGYCRFEFPKDVKYCTIPVNVEGVPIYPRTSDGMNGVYVAGPFVYLALKLGAKVYCDRGFFLNTRFTEDGHESRSMLAAISKFVKERGEAKDLYGKGSLQEILLKLMVNSVYGKNSQNVIQKQTWSAFKDTMEDIGCSCITNPFSAMMTTAIVQCELLAAQNELHEKGFGTYSVTTDGFISDCPLDVIHDLKLYGFKDVMKQARLFLTDGTDPSLWEEKHRQSDLVNFTTRGNVSLEADGVIARNSFKTGFERGSFEDRHALYIGVLTRTGPLTYTDEKWSSLKEMLKNERGFYTYKQKRNIRMDFDMKRKPDRDSFCTDEVYLDGQFYTIAHFETVPFENIEEFLLYRSKKSLCKCLRTQKEWDLFFAKVDSNCTNASIRDLDWSIIMSVVMGYRSGKWLIPEMDEMSVDEKCKHINKYNDSTKEFKVNDWKNARRPERQCNMLPTNLLQKKLIEMNAQIL